MAGHRLILHIGSMPFSNIPAMAGAGDRIVDLHSLLSEISPEISAYLFPGLDSGTLEETCTRIGKELGADTGDRENAGNFAVLQDGRLVPAEKALLMPERGYSSCVQEPDYGFRPTEDSVNVRDVRRYSLDKSRKSRSQRSRLRKIRDGLFPVEAGLEPDAEENIPYGAMPVLSAPAVTALDIPDETDSRTEAILSEIQRIQSKFGVTIDELEIILNYRIKLSRLLITRRNEIFMSDFDNREIKMDHLSKAVFFLYLRHPEGIRFKDLPEYRDELLQIYMRITGRDNMEDIRKSIDDIADPLGNAINVKVSRVKSAFRSAVSDRIARYYYIDGQAGSAKRILLDRDFVIWEKPAPSGK